MARLLCTLVIGTTVFLSGFVRTSTGAPIDVAIPGNLTVWSAIISSLPAPTTTPRIPKPAIPLPCTNGNGCPNGDQCQDGLCEETKICGGFIGIECPDGYFCLTPPGTADFFGTCIKVPTFLLPCNPPCPEPRYCIDPGCGMQFCAPPIPQLLLAVDSRTQNDTPTPTDTSITPSNSLTPTIPTSSTNSNIVTSSVPAPTTTSEGPRPTEPITCKDGSSCPKGYQCQEGLCEHPKKCGGFVGIECPDGYFCLTPPGTADEFGTCIKIPQFPSPCNPSCPDPRYCIDPSCEIQICVPSTLQLPDIKKSNKRLARRQDPGVIYWTDFTPVETEPPMITEVIPWTIVTTPTPNTFPFTSTTPFGIETNSTMSVAVLPTTTTDTPFPSMTISPSLV